MSWFLREQAAERRFPLLSVLASEHNISPLKRLQSSQANDFETQYGLRTLVMGGEESLAGRSSLFLLESAPIAHYVYLQLFFEVHALQRAHAITSRSPRSPYMVQRDRFLSSTDYLLSQSLYEALASRGMVTSLPSRTVIDFGGPKNGRRTNSRHPSLPVRKRPLTANTKQGHYYIMQEVTF
ncbi:hypothetical protein BJ165DRAFT_1409155 [Panaeolus papilionaceus]|nr:hypothetical protein BJ165DRAFT_1409155 [Panaeolus papilionaceus]